MQTGLTSGPNRVDSSGYYGFYRVRTGWVYREYAPGANQVLLAGEFNDWNWESHPLMDLGNGSWVLYLPGENALWEGCKVKTRVDGTETQQYCAVSGVVCSAIESM